MTLISVSLADTSVLLLRSAPEVVGQVLEVRPIIEIISFYSS